MEEKIIIKGARVHNLKNINLELPHNKLVVFTGVSGSGKSSLAFDTIFAEGQRRYIESLSPYVRQFLGQMKPADVDEIIGLAPSISIDQRSLSHNPRSTVGTLTEIYDYLRVLYARLGEVFCPLCGDKIAKLSVDEMVDIILAKAKDRQEDQVMILSPVVRGRKGEYYQLLYDFLSLGYSQVRIDGKFHSLHDKVDLARYKKHDIDIVIDKVWAKEPSRLFEAVENALDHGQGVVTVLFGTNGKKLEELSLSSNWTCPNDNFSFPDLEPRLFSFNSPHGACPECHGLGLIDFSDDDKVCTVCKGQRLRPEALSVKISKKDIAQVTAMSIQEVHDFFVRYFEKMPNKDRSVAEPVVIEVVSRLEFLLKVGLNYLSLSRRADTLSGGEAQRIRLSSQIGSHLSRTLYVLDEPTIGLHERDTERLIDTLKSLRDQNNSVIVVEHDEQTILESDYFVDLGPLAGVHGGEIVISGPTKDVLVKANTAKSLTIDYIIGDKRIPVPSRRTKRSETLKLVGARANNLKNLQVEIPLRKLVGITGVSGSGKSTLLYDVLYKNLSAIKNRPGRYKLDGVTHVIGSEYVSKVIVIDQAPIGRTPRSNPATYTGIFTPIRDFFALLPEARERGYTLSRFSFNRAGGRCEACDGAGFKLIEMHFLPAVYVECDVCRGKRFNRETLQVKHKGKNIADVLSLTIEEAVKFFDGNYHITDKLKVLQEVGLGYLQLGQSATTLSGGEAQRIKLARELTHTLGKRSLYLLDEPTVGLHYYDIELLLKVLNKLVDKGNSVVVIEHNMHMIKSMDYVIDLGPEGGEAGGKVVAKGTPENVVGSDKSVTGHYLKAYLK